MLVGKNNEIEVHSFGDFHGEVLDREGIVREIVLRDVRYIPNFCVNFFSLTKVMDLGWRFFRDGNKDIVIERERMEVKFDVKLSSERGYVKAIEVRTKAREMGVSLALITENVVRKMDDNQVMLMHRMLGHACGKYTANTIKRITGESVSRDFLKCADCDLGKSSQKRVPKVCKGRSGIPGERVYVDVAYTTVGSYGGAKYWGLLVDEFSWKKWSVFLSTKDQLCDNICKVIVSNGIIKKILNT